jgi:hypothetical protein
MVGHRRELPLRAAGCENHVVGDGGFGGEIDGDDLFGLVGVERGFDELEDRFYGRRNLAFASRYVDLLGWVDEAFLPVPAGAAVENRCAALPTNALLEYARRRRRAMAPL